ncbi:MAG: hypothetical protein GQ564_03785 [Bacteroidales bacterium]|nr:hypothetical protein [Bacteroidales bacterium]
MDLRFVDIPKIENDEIFEDLTKALTQASGLYKNINVNGRPGQKQNGVDVYARKQDNSDWIGIQCKVRSTNNPFTKKALLLEVNQAKEFNPKLSEYYLYTTLSRDSVTQGNVREIACDLADENEFSFEVFFWEDIEGMLKQKDYEAVYYRFYHKFFRDNLSLGHSIGKLINLHLGFENKLDSQYDLKIGKIPSHNGEKSRADYYRGSYYITNLNEKRIEFFQKKHDSEKAQCFRSDISAAFPNQVDCYRISKWIESFDVFDDLIYNDTHNYTFYLSNKERAEFDEYYYVEEE